MLGPMMTGPESIDVRPAGVGLIHLEAEDALVARRERHVAAPAVLAFSTVAAITAIRSALGHILLTPEADAAVATVPGEDLDFRYVDEL